jgi:hypothetical protein
VRCRPPSLPNRPHFDADSIDSAIPRPSFDFSGLRFSIFFSSRGLTRVKGVARVTNLFCHAGNLCVTPLDFSSLHVGGE